MAIKTRTEQIIDLQDWDELVSKTYGRVYSFQQQDGCKSRGLVFFVVPDSAEEYDYENDTVPEVVNHDDMGVSFAAWLARDPNQPLDGNGNPNEATDDKWQIDLWWSRNFYPNLVPLANDLLAKGLIEAGEYAINIDW